MTYQERIELLTIDLISEVVRQQYISDDVGDKFKGFVKNMCLTTFLLDLDEYSLLSCYLFSATYKFYITAYFEKYNFIVMEGYYPYNKKKRIDAKYTTLANLTGYFIKYDKNMYDLLMNYYIISSTHDYKTSDVKGRMALLSFVPQEVTAVQKFPVISWAAVPHPLWFIPPESDPYDWNQAVRVVNQSLVEHLFSTAKIGSNKYYAQPYDLKQIALQIVKCDCCIISPEINALLPYFMYQRTRQTIMTVAFDLSHLMVIVYGYRKKTLHRVHRRYHVFDAHLLVRDRYYSQVTVDNVSQYIGTGSHAAVIKADEIRSLADELFHEISWNTASFSTLMEYY